ncbi:MAG: HAD family hydrolase, partial [Thermodesulfobacteriota bacterium]|nr:HAD family hydrolase [Thermodesulfobacteriota bacterium]
MERIENVLLDRDGTIIKDKNYLSDPDGVELLPGAGQGLAGLAKSGIRLFLVTNQSGIARGYFKEKDYWSVQERLGQVLLSFGVILTDTAFCPHGPNDNCACRKPAPGMGQHFFKTHGLDPARTVMIGDKASDIAFGLNCGLCASVLVLTGKGRDQAKAYGLPDLKDSSMALLPRGPDWPHILARD